MTRRIRFIVCPAFLAGWSLLWLAGGCGPSSTEQEAITKQNLEDEQKASENSAKGL